MSQSRRSSIDLSAGVAPPLTRRSSVDYSAAGVGQISRRTSVDFSSGVGTLGLPLRSPSVDTGFHGSVGTSSRRPSVDYSTSGENPPSGSYGRQYGTSSITPTRRYGSSFDMGTSRYGSSGNKYGGGGGYGGSSYLNTSYGTPRTSAYRQSSYEPRLSSYGGGGSGGNVMDRIKQFAPAEQSRSSGYTPLMSRKAQQRDYGGGGGGGNWDKHSARSGGSDYSNRSGYMSDYGGSTPSLYSSLDRASSRSGLHSRETSPVTNRMPRNYDYSSSASPSPYSTYKSSPDTQSPSIAHKFERQGSRPSDPYERGGYERQSSRPPEVYDRQNSRQSDIYEEPPARPRRRWEQEVYGTQSSREPLPASVKPPPKDYSDSESEDSAPEDDKGHKLRYMMSRGTSPYHDTRDYRRNESGTGIAKAIRVKNARSPRPQRPDLRRKRVVDCAIQTNLDEPSPRRSRRGGGENPNTREDVAKLAALALLQEGGGNDADMSDTFYKYRDKFQGASPGRQQPSPGRQQPSPRRQEGSKFNFDDSSTRMNRNERDQRYHDDTLDVPDEKAWRKAVYGGDSSPSRSPGLRRHQTEEDLRQAGEMAKAKRLPKTSTPKVMREPEDMDADYDSPVEDRPPSGRERRSYNDSENEKRRSRQSDGEKRRSKQRSSSRDSILDDRPPSRRRQRTSSRELLDEPSSPKQKVPLTPDSLSLRDSIDKVETWKQQLPPVNHHLNVDGVHRNPETGFPRSDSGEYFSAVEHNSASGRASRDSDRRYKDKMYAQQSPTSPTTRHEPLKSEHEDEVLSPGGRRKRNRRHLSREMSTDSVLDDDDLTHHPVNKERYRKSELNRSEELERYEREELERRKRIYSGADDLDDVENVRQSGNSSEVFTTDDYGRARDRRHIARQGSREDVLDEKRTRKHDRRETDPHASDSSTFGFNRESSPNRPSSRTKRHSRNNSRDDVLKDKIVPQHDQAQYMRPHSMGVSNESLAKLSGAASIASMNSALTNDGPIRNSVSQQSLESNEARERPTEERFPQSASQHSVNSAGSGGSLPDIVPGEEGNRAQVSNKPRTKSGYIGGTQDIDNLLSFSPNEEDFVEKGKDLDEVLKSRQSHLMDTPVPREPSPLKPQVSEEKLIDLDESSPVFSPTTRSPRPQSPTQPRPSSSRARSPDHSVSSRYNKNKKTADPEPKPAGHEMWDMLKGRKGLVVIGDILGLCEKPQKKKRFISVPGDEDKRFRGYNTANELLENLQVDTKKLEDCALQIYRYHNGTQGDYGTYLDLESTIDEQSEDLEGFQDQLHIIRDLTKKKPRRKNALILRTQLTVRVHAVIEKLLNSNGRELRRALFSLKQIFQDDKDLVHEFVNNDGLDCLIKVGAEADQNYQNYILRALGQVMLYVDGMNGVINHNATIQWLYSLLSSKVDIRGLELPSQLHEGLEVSPLPISRFRLVVKTALKLLLVFVEYTESNTQHLVKAVNTVDKKRLEKPWTNIMMILDEKDGGDSELLVYAMTLVNKVLNAIPDQDTFFDVTDYLEELGMERITQRHMNRKGADLDLLSQFQQYDAALKAEDGEEDEIGQLENLRRTPRIKSEEESGRKSRRFSTGVAPGKNRAFLNQDDVCPADDYKTRKLKMKEMVALPPEEHEQHDKMPDQKKRWSKFSQNKENEEHPKYINGAPEKSPSCEAINDINTTESLVGDTPRSRRERRARQRDFIKAQENGIPAEARTRLSVASNSSTSTCSSVGSGQVAADTTQDPKYSSLSSLSDTESIDNQKMGREPPDKHGYRQGNKLEDTKESGYHSNFESANNELNDSMNGDTNDMQGISNNRRWLMYKMAHKDSVDEPEDNFQRAQPVPAAVSVSERKDNLHKKPEPLSVNKNLVEQLEKDSKVKSGLDRFGKKTEDAGPNKAAGPLGDKTGLISQAMENLTKKNEPAKPEPVIKKPDVKLTESDLQWERLAKRFHRSLKINDMDFTDLNDEEDTDVFAPPKLDFEGGVGGPPPPPPPGGIPPPPGMVPPPPPPMGGMPPPPPPPGGLVPPPPPPFGSSSASTSAVPTVSLPPPAGANLKKNKKTLKLHWKTVQPETPHPATKGETIWKDIIPVKVDPEKLEHLFENRASETKQKRQEAHGKKQITVLDPKRSNAINIGLTVLPPPRTIKAAILKMDNSIMNKEGIEKVLNGMIPSEEEKAKILEAQLANPDIPLGTAEQFLLTLSSISELQSRLCVWLFKLDYENIEMEVAEPLMDLKHGIEELLKNKTFRYIISAILTIGNFLNGSQVRGFSVDYLTKVPEVKDTVHKHSLLHHLCSIIIEQFPDSTDLYSDIGPITRCGRVDWDELHKKLERLEVDCKASWDNLRAIVKHDGSSNSQLKSKMSEFLGDAAERIMILQVVHRRVMNRYNKLLLYMGFPLHQAKDLKVNQFCKTLSEFALEYRTTREKVVQQLEKKANQRERKKTRGKMIVDMGKFKGSKGSRSNDDQGGEDALHRVLANGYTSETDRGLPGRQARKKVGPADHSKRHSVSSSRGCATTDSEMYDTGDDEILEACVRTATTPSTRNPRERKRARNSRKSSLSQSMQYLDRLDRY